MINDTQTLLIKETECKSRIYKNRKIMVNSEGDRTKWTLKNWNWIRWNIRRCKNLRKNMVSKQIYQGPIISAIITQKEIENTPEISNNDAVDVMMAQTKWNRWNNCSNLPPSLILNLTVVGRLNFKKSQLFFTKFAYDYNFMCRMPGIDQKVDLKNHCISICIMKLIKLKIIFS